MCAAADYQTHEWERVRLCMSHALRKVYTLTCFVRMYAQAFVDLVRGGSGDVGRRLVVLPAFETLPFKASGNAAVDDMTHRVADFAQAADKAAIKVGCCC